jgi:hypothetical protein
MIPLALPDGKANVQPMISKFGCFVNSREKIFPNRKKKNQKIVF